MLGCTVVASRKRFGVSMDDSVETAYLAGGCAWIMQPLLTQPVGVVSTRTGWMGGQGEDPTEENDGGHAETIQVVFDPGRLSYRGLLEVFFQVHRADLAQDVVGSIYRSEIFYTSEDQRGIAEEMIRDVDASGHWLGKTVTKVSRAGVFWEDGPEHQDYLQRFPDVFRAPFPRQETAPESVPASG
jgi:peptide-methionine (S)-S-oxide reductase